MKLVVIITALCVSVVIATVLILQLPSNKESGAGPTPREVDKEAPAYAYITSEELVLMRGDQAVARVSRVFDEADSYQNRVVWTQSGDYVVPMSGVTLAKKILPRKN